MRKVMDGDVTLSRSSDNKVYIRVRDKNSRTEFVTIAMTLENYARLTTNEAFVAATLETRDLDRVGKYKITESRRAVLKGTFHSVKKLTKWLEKNKREEGWHLDTYLGSKSSIQIENGKTIVNYRVHKWVKQPEVSINLKGSAA